MTRPFLTPLFITPNRDSLAAQSGSSAGTRAGQQPVASQEPSELLSPPTTKKRESKGTPASAQAARLSFQRPLSRESAGSAPKSGHWWWLSDSHVMDAEKRRPCDEGYDPSTVFM